MTAVEWFFRWVNDNPEATYKEYAKAFEQAKKMEKQQMQDFGARCCLLTKQKNEWTLEELYNDLYRSKGSGDASSQTEISDDRTKLHWKTSLVVHTPKISDNEIEEAAEKGGFYGRVLSASPPPNTFTFSLKNNEPIIVLSEEGFKYKEELIEDAGEVYKLFKEFLIKANRPTEISDEEIEKAAYKYAEVYQCPTEIKMCKHDAVSAWIQGIKWYREQLKKKQ